MKPVSVRALFFVIGLFCLVFTCFSPVAAQQGDPAEVGVFDDIAVSPDTRFEIPISVRNVDNLYAVDITLTFDAEIMQIEDANPALEGVQLALGTFLDAGLILFNTADNETGTIRFAMTQVNPSEPKTGEGVLLVLYAQATEEGESQIEVASVELANRLGEAIPGTGAGSTLTISSGTVERENTPIPVQDPTLGIQVPTPEPTATPTFSPDPTPTPTAVLVDDEDNNNPEQQALDNGEEENLKTDSGGSESEDPGLNQPAPEGEAGQTEPLSNQTSEGFSLLRYWWAVVLLAVVAVGLAIYLAATRR